MDLNL